MGLHCRREKIRACAKAEALSWLLLSAIFGLATPVNAGSRELAAVPVPTVIINPGDVIRDVQIAEKEFDARIRNRNFYQNSRDVVGRMARHVLLPGRPIAITSLKEAFLVSAGDTITVKFSAAGLEVTGHALALHSGRLGDTISCRNVDTGVVIRGKVIDAALVQTGIE